MFCIYAERKRGLALLRAFNYALSHLQIFVLYYWDFHLTNWVKYYILLTYS